MFGERAARWAEEEEEAGMDVGIACLLASSRAAVGLRRALAARLDGPGFAHWLTQQQSLRSESCRSIRVDRTGVEESREQRDSAGVKGRGDRPSHAPCPLITCLLYSRRHARTRTPLRAIRTLDYYGTVCACKIHCRLPPDPCG